MSMVKMNKNRVSQLLKEYKIHKEYKMHKEYEIHRQDIGKERAWIELDRKKLHQNVAALQAILPCGSQLMPVVKADAYGHDVILISRELNRMGVRTFCVSTVLEGVKMRKKRIRGEILVLGYTDPKQFHLLKKYSLTQSVLDYSYAQTLNAYGKRLKVHIKIDTGMHRMGESSRETEKLCRVCSFRNLIVTGAYTHLCASESTDVPNRELTEKQGKAFYKAIGEMEKQNRFHGKVHLLASCGLLNYPELAGDYVRVGVALYGILCSRLERKRCAVPLRPVLSVYARVALVKEVHAGENVGYGFCDSVNTDRKIAVITIGYADGLPRALSCGRGSVLVKGRKALIIGCICMDQTIVDVTGIPEVQVGDIATVIGKSGNAEITVYDIAEAAGTVTIEIVSRLGSRLERVMK